LVCRLFKTQKAANKHRNFTLVRNAVGNRSYRGISKWARRANARGIQGPRDPERQLMLNRRSWLGSLLLSAAALLAFPSHAAEEAPEVLVKRISDEVMTAIKADPAIQAGDINRIVALVDTKIMPNVNFARMTSSAVGRFWRQATPAQQKQLQDEFKILLVRTYSGALGEVKDQTVSFKPLRARAEDTEVVVRSEVRGRGEPVQLDYRLEKTPTGWKIYDLNVLGVWLVETYRTQFAQEINAKGIDGLIQTLSQRNKSNSTAKAS
jgi:phospholipid transport system substrate-binding protein